MGRVIDLESRRDVHRENVRDTRTRELREALRSAREGAETQQESTRKLLNLFKKNPPRKPN